MMNPTSKPFFPSQGAPDQGKKPEWSKQTTWVMLIKRLIKA